MWWQVGTVANAVIASAYLLISLAIARPLLQSGQLRSNPLGLSTAAIFFSCAVYHAGHVAYMLLPAFGLRESVGIAWRAAYDWPSAVCDVVGALLGVYYWTMRRSYGSLMDGAQLFLDMRKREKQALELNDAVLQGMVVAKLALDLDEPDRAQEALESAIAAASKIISGLLSPSAAVEAKLLRSEPATLAHVDGVISDHRALDPT